MEEKDGKEELFWRGEPAREIGKREEERREEELEKEEEKEEDKDENTE